MGPFPSGAPELSSPFGGRALGRAGVDRCPRPRAGDAGLAAPETPAGRLRPRTGCARLSPPPHPSPGSRRSPETRPPGARPARARRSPAAAAPATPARAGARPPGPRPCPRPAPSGPRSPLLAPSPTFPRDKPGDRYPAWPTPQGSGERPEGPGRQRPPRLSRAAPRPPALPPPGPRPRRPLPGLAQLTPCTRAHAAQPRCSTYLQSLLSSHHNMPWKPGPWPPLASVLGRRGRR